MLLSSIPNPQLIGVDESGVTAYAGPVSAAAVEPDPSASYSDLVLDCKLLDASQLKEAYGDVIIKSKRWAVAYGSPAEIDRMGIWRASQLAMRRAVRAILDVHPTRNPVVLVDYTTIPGIHCLQWPLEQGDSIALSIAAASIVAKYSRDTLMVELSKEYPAYAWDKNKGAPTRAHQDAIKKHGKTIHHRSSWTTKLIKEVEGVKAELQPMGLDSALTESSDLSRLNKSFVSLVSSEASGAKSLAHSTMTPTHQPKSTNQDTSAATPAINPGTL